MGSSLRRLEVLVDIWIVIGPLLLVIGSLLIFSNPGVLPLLGFAAVTFGGLLLLGALIGKVALLAVRAIDEMARERSSSIEV